MMKLKLKLPGMRILKTSLAVFLCLMISLVQPNETNTFFACTAAIITLKGNLRDSWSSSLIRIQATVLGAAAGLIGLELRLWLNLQPVSAVYYLLVSVLVFLVIWVSITFMKADGAALGCIVLLSITINHVTDTSPLEFALNRFLYTVVGVIIALIVNRVLPNQQEKKHEDDAAAGLTAGQGAEQKILQEAEQSDESAKTQ